MAEREEEPDVASSSSYRNTGIREAHSAGSLDHVQEKEQVHKHPVNISNSAAQSSSSQYKRQRLMMDEEIMQPSAARPDVVVPFPAVAGERSRDAKYVHIHGPNVKKIQEMLLSRPDYTLKSTTGQRKYSRNPPYFDPPPNGCEISYRQLSLSVYEDELIPTFEKFGIIWNHRLMTNPKTSRSLGYGCVTFTKPEAAEMAVLQLNDKAIRGQLLEVSISIPNLRLLVRNIPKCKDQVEIKNEFARVTAGLVKVMDKLPGDRRRNRGTCLLEYDSHGHASLAKDTLASGKIQIFGCSIVVDKTNPEEVAPNSDTTRKVRVDAFVLIEK